MELYVLGILDYYFIIKIEPPQMYVSTSAPPISSVVPNIVENIKQFYTCVFIDFKNVWLLLICILMICFIISTTGYSQRNKILTAVVAGVFLSICLVMAFGLYPVLSDTLVCPRSMYGFCVFLAFLGVEVAKQGRQLLLQIPSIVLCWSFFVFSFTYGNALAVQKEYAEFRIEQVISDLNDLECLEDEGKTRLSIAGTIGHSPILEAMPEDGKILRNLVPIVFYGEDSGDGWGRYRLFYYYKMQSFLESDMDETVDEEDKVLKDTMYHTIYGNGDRILVQLK